jgi:hypothetical protein
LRSDNAQTSGEALYTGEPISNEPERGVGRIYHLERPLGVRARFGQCPRRRDNSYLGCNNYEVEWYAEQMLYLDPNRLPAWRLEDHTAPIASGILPWPSPTLACTDGPATVSPIPL